jgi:hypothetical protein
MAKGSVLPFGLPDGMTALRAEAWPPHPGETQEIRFSADWPGITLVCSRPLARLLTRGLPTPP